MDIKEYINKEIIILESRKNEILEEEKFYGLTRDKNDRFALVVGGLSVLYKMREFILSKKG